MIVPWGFVLLLHFLFCCFCSQEQSVYKVVVAFEGVCQRKVRINTFFYVGHMSSCYNLAGMSVSVCPCVCVFACLLVCLFMSRSQS